MNGQNFQQAARQQAIMQQARTQQIRAQKTKFPAAQPRQKKNLIGSLIRFIIIAAFFIGAYMLLSRLGIIDKVKEGFFLLRQI